MPKHAVARKAVYCTSTVLFCLMTAASAVMYLTSPQMAGAFTHLGFPAYFRIELAVAKLLGVTVLLAPVPRRLKEWAYAGFTITLMSAFIAHLAVDGPAATVPPLVVLGLLLVSYAFAPVSERDAEFLGGRSTTLATE